MREHLKLQGSPEPLTTKEQIRQNAENAIQWAQLPCSHKPYRSNYAQLLEDVCRAASHARILSFEKSHTLSYVHQSYWPCLSRLLILDEPELISFLCPHFIEQLDNQQMTSLIQLWFQEVTKGRTPQLRSWRIVNQEVSS